LLAVAQRWLLPAGGPKPIGTHPQKFPGLNTLKVGSTRYLCASPAYLACPSTHRLPDAPQGSVLGLRRTISQAGLAPAKVRGLARPYSPLFPFSDSQHRRFGLFLVRVFEGRVSGVAQLPPT
jgi:hypothetical protein